MIGCDKSSSVIDSEQAEESSDANDQSNIHIAMDWPAYNSLEEFLSFLETPEKGEDFAELSSLDRYYLPTGIPETYKLYKIVAGKSDIGFFYLPEEWLESKDKILEAESLEKNFLFIFFRWDLDDPMASIMERYGVTRENLINENYLHVEMQNTIYWGVDNALMMLYLPRTIYSESGEQGVLNDIDSLISLCTTEVVYLR